MSLPRLYAHPETEDEWKGWAFNHAANHYDWVMAAQRGGSAGLQQFILSPVNPDELGMWLYEHQTAHDQINSALGTKGYNLLSLDWRNPEQFATWLRQNGDEHLRISAALGVG